ncbi:AIR synthase [Candidatus Woesearchaeota archaeon]|nr:AIR synthase [Candidatus Woesearchaeota archaeon]
MEKIGKVGLKTFENFLKKRLGKENKNVIVPPMTGVDAGVVDIGSGKVLIIAEDPIFPAPKQPLDTFGWYTVHIGASDIAVMGVKPQYMTYSLLMPPDTKEEELKTIVDSIHRTAKELDISIVGGHTGYYPGISYPLIGGITVFSVAEKGSYVTPAGAKPGDDVIMTKGPAIEAAGLLAVLYEKKLLENNGKEIVDKAKEVCKQMTCVKDALTAVKAGGVSAMHDATEGGVIGGLFEMANASSVGMEIDENKFVSPKEVEMVCKELDIDPVEAIAEGTLLITCNAESSEKIISALGSEGIKASVIGKVTDTKDRRMMKRKDGSIRKLAVPEQDPFWPVFFEGAK